MDKLIAMHHEEELDEQRLKETIAYRDQILKLVEEITSMQEKIRVGQCKVNVTKAQVFQLRTDVSMLTKQVEEINRSLRDKLENVLKEEEQLKRNKVLFHNSIREKTEKAKQFLTQPQIVTLNNEANSSTAAQRAAWTLQGENDAFTVIKQFQIGKLEEIASISGIAEELIVEDVEENSLKNIN